MDIFKSVTGLYHCFLNLVSSASGGELKVMTVFYLRVPTLHQFNARKNISCYSCLLGFWFSVTWSIHPCFEKEN